MCPQAALPDLNTAWIKYRTEVLAAIKSKNYNSMFGSLFAINAMLPKDYQVEISDRKYYDKIKQDVIVICNHCSKVCEHCIDGKGECIAETKRDDIKIKNVIGTILTSILINNKTEKLWQCPKCNKNNILSRTRIIQNVLKEPFFIKIVPSPPSRKDGIIHRREYPKKVEKWAYQFLDELEHQMSKFRLEYVPKDTEFGEESLPDGQETLDF